jgi:ribosomal protein S18 acetylase RimI-like enzyme
MKPCSDIPLVIRKARTRDLSALVHLLGLLFEQEKEFKAQPAKQVKALRWLLTHPQHASLWVAVSEGHVVGMAALHWRMSTAWGRCTAWLEDLVVLPSYRSQGIGTALMGKAMGQARQKKAASVSLLTDGDNHRAQAFYQRAGFNFSSMRVMRKIP